MSAPLSIQDKVVTTVAVISGIALLGLGVTQCQKPSATTEIVDSFSDFDPNAAFSEDELINEYSDDLSSLKVTIADQSAEIKKLKASNTESQDLLKLYRANTTGSESSNSALIAGAGGAALLGEQALGAKTESNDEELLATIKLKEEELSKLQQLAADKEGALTAEVETLTKANETLLKKLEDNEALAGKGDYDQLLQTAIEEKNKELSLKLDDQKILLTKNFETEKAQLNDRIKELNLQIRKGKSKKVFADSKEDLGPKAQQLITTLEGLEGQNADQVATAYEGLKGSLNSHLKTRILFGSGKNGVSPEENAQLQSIMKEAGEDSYFLAVGYADTSGSSEGNKALSKKRALSVAGSVKAVAKENQSIQAIYLGSTDRFGSKAQNRVVEVWEIKP